MSISKDVFEVNTASIISAHKIISKMLRSIMMFYLLMKKFNILQWYNKYCKTRARNIDINDWWDSKKNEQEQRRQILATILPEFGRSYLWIWGCGYIPHKKLK